MIWWTAFLVLVVTDLDTCKKRYWARFGCSIIWWRQAFTSGTQHEAQEGLPLCSNLLPSHMKCRVGLLQQSRPFSTVYSKREAALESSLQPRSEPSAAFSEGWSAGGRRPTGIEAVLAGAPASFPFKRWIYWLFQVEMAANAMWLLLGSGKLSWDSSPCQ